MLIRENYYNAALISAVAGLTIYSIWAIAKNAKYTPSSWYWLPILQIVSDAAVMCGSINGIFNQSSTFGI